MLFSPLAWYNAWVTPQGFRPFYPDETAGTAYWNYKGLTRNDFVFVWNPGYGSAHQEQAIYRMAVNSQDEKSNLEDKLRRTRQEAKNLRKSNKSR